MNLKPNQPNGSSNLSPNHPSEVALWNQLSELKAELNSYRSEVVDLRSQLAESQAKLVINNKPLVNEAQLSTSRRRMLQKLVAGAAGLGALTLAASVSNSPAAQAAPPAANGDTAVDASGGPTGYGARLSGGLSQLFLDPTATVINGTPTSGDHAKGELFVDAGGDLYYCVTAGTGSAAKWRKLAGSATSGSLHLMPSPGRFVDTRPAPNNRNDAAGAIAGPTVRTYNITSLTGSGGVTIPAGATGISGNITVTGNNVGGFGQLYPTGSTPTVSTINFSGGVDAANSFTTALNASGQVSVILYFYATGQANLIIDINGYYL